MFKASLLAEALFLVFADGRKAANTGEEPLLAGQFKTSSSSEVNRKPTTNIGVIVWDHSVQCPV